VGVAGGVAVAVGGGGGVIVAAIGPNGVAVDVAAGSRVAITAAVLGAPDIKYPAILVHAPIKKRRITKVSMSNRRS
jgi:hypothetical protein